MKRTLLTLALIAAAATAGAQTMQTQGSGNTSTDTQMNSGTGANALAGVNTAPEMANAPRMTGEAGTAQKRIEADGYKNVTGLAKGPDGLWHGTAMRGNTQVQVTVDRSGKVAAQ